MPGKRANKGLTVDQVIATLKETHGNMSLAARRLGVERNTIRHYIDHHPTVKQAHDEAANAVSDIAEGHLVNGAIKGDWDKVKYWLETKARDRGYGRAHQVEVTGKDGGPMEYRVFEHQAAVASLAARPAPDRDELGTDESRSDGA